MDDDTRYDLAGDRETWHPELKKALSELDSLSRHDQDLLLAYFAKNGFGLQRLQQLLRTPSVITYALNEARLRRPMISFVNYVTQVSMYSAPRWLDDENTAKRMFGADIVFQQTYKVSRLATRLEKEAKKLCCKHRIYDHTPPEQIERLTPSEWFNATGVAPLIYLNSGSVENDWNYLWSKVSGFCTEQFARTLFRREDDTTFKRVWFSLVPEEMGARLMRFGLHELNSSEFGDLDQIRSALPPGARFAGLETIAAIAEYPLLLKWIDQSPNGGYRHKRAELWLMGIGCDDRGKCQHLHLMHERDVFGAPRLSGCFFDELTAYNCTNATVIIPYLIPIASYSLNDLKRMLEEPSQS